MYAVWEQKWHISLIQRLVLTQDDEYLDFIVRFNLEVIIS
jgi:hypothetical protein